MQKRKAKSLHLFFFINGPWHNVSNRDTEKFSNFKISTSKLNVQYCLYCLFHADFFIYFFYIFINFYIYLTIVTNYLIQTRQYQIDQDRLPISSISWCHNSRHGVTRRDTCVSKVAGRHALLHSYLADAYIAYISVQVSRACRATTGLKC